MARGMTCWICWNSQSWLGCLQFVGTSNWALLEYINAGSAKTEPLLDLLNRREGGGAKPAMVGGLMGRSSHKEEGLGMGWLITIPPESSLC